jgi:uncharacterized OB-fold protein
MCPYCGSVDWWWERSMGRGRVYSWSTTVRPMHPWYTAVPYASVLVELDEGPRVLTWVDIDPEDLVVGMRVEVGFDLDDPEVTLTNFRPVKDVEE